MIGVWGCSSLRYCSTKLFAIGEEEAHIYIYLLPKSQYNIILIIRVGVAWQQYTLDIALQPLFQHLTVTEYVIFPIHTCTPACLQQPVESELSRNADKSSFLGIIQIRLK